MSLPLKVGLTSLWGMAKEFHHDEILLQEDHPSPNQVQVVSWNGILVVVTLSIWKELFSCLIFRIGSIETPFIVLMVKVYLLNLFYISYHKCEKHMQCNFDSCKTIAYIHVCALIVTRGKPTTCHLWRPNFTPIKKTGIKTSRRKPQGITHSIVYECVPNGQSVQLIPTDKLNG